MNNLTKDTIWDKIIYIKIDNINSFYNDQYIDYLSDKIYLTINITNYNNYRYSSYNHIQLNYHYTHIIPIICKLLDINFNINNFNLISNIHELEDFSYLKPKKDNQYKLDILNLESLNLDTYYGTFDDIIINKDNKFDKYRIDKNDFYHNIYSGGSALSRLENISNNSERKLVIFGDSQCIPWIPILSEYFKTITIFDNRFGFYENNYWYITEPPCKFNELNEDFTDAIYMVNNNAHLYSFETKFMFYEINN